VLGRVPRRAVDFCPAQGRSVGSQCRRGEAIDAKFAKRDAVAGPEAKMRTRVKVCCIASIEEADIAIGAGADAIGW
jgi:hypothetical protein